MRLSKLTIRNYRQFRETDVLVGGLALLVGEHASGKTNFLRALRLLFDPTLSYEERLPTLADFGDYGDGIADAITIQAEVQLTSGESTNVADPSYVSAAEPNTARVQFVAHRSDAGISMEITAGDGAVPKSQPWELFAVAYVDGDLLAARRRWHAMLAPANDGQPLSTHKQAAVAWTVSRGDIIAGPATIDAPLPIDDRSRSAAQAHARALEVYALLATAQAPLGILIDDIDLHLNAPEQSIVFEKLRALASGRLIASTNSVTVTSRVDVEYILYFSRCEGFGSAQVASLSTLATEVRSAVSSLNSVTKGAAFFARSLLLVDIAFDAELMRLVASAAEWDLEAERVCVADVLSLTPSGGAIETVCMAARAVGLARVVYLTHRTVGAAHESDVGSIFLLHGSIAQELVNAGLVVSSEILDAKPETASARIYRQALADHGDVARAFVDRLRLSVQGGK